MVATVLGVVAPADAGSMVIPGWSYAGGNVRIDADPAKCADAGPVAVSGPKQPWGWTVEYEFDVPVEADYTLLVCYASPDPRPMHVRIDSGWVGLVGYSATFDRADGSPTGKGSSATWEWVCRWGRTVRQRLSKGKHTVRLTRRQELPNIVALRLDTDTEFPEEWQPRYTARNMDGVPAEHRKAFLTAAGPRLDLPPAPTTATAEIQGTIGIPATTFDRGNARIYASPDRYALTDPLAGDGAKPGEENREDKGRTNSYVPRRDDF